jgi:cytosol alanyl aminopeptidase
MKRTALAALALAGLACSGEPLPPVKSPAPSASVTTSAAPAPAPAPPAFRLPADAVPKKVAATLTIVPKEDTFRGAVDIDIEVAKPTRVLWLHATELTVSEASLSVGGKKLAARVVPGGQDFVGFAFDEELPVGPARLSATYTGKVSDRDDRGVFRESEGEDSYLYTQFETIYARRAFPCFDEPQLKIPWQLTLRVKATDTALSNTPVVEEKAAEPGWKTVRFAETKPLPSYLVAFAVGPFEMLDAGRAGKNKTPIRFAVPRGRGAEAKYSMGASGKILELLEETFGIPYPYEKLDYVIIPQLASFGAMENVGLITANARAMLAKPGEDTPLHRRHAALLIAHEAAHQWFGDLVTMAFWDDIWLNEGFATWMEEKIVSKLDPSLNTSLAQLEAYSWVKGQDGLLSARKVRQEIGSNDDIYNAFDGITYQKGGALLEMFEAWTGQEAFRKGVKLYLERFSHRNATSSDFLAAVSEGSGKDIQAAFSSFLEQPGIPVVSSKLSCDASGAKLALSQERFLPTGSKGSAANGVWQVPVCAHYGAGKESGRACTLLTGKTGEIALPAFEGKKGKGACPDWVMPNADGKGYYYSAYSQKDIAGLLGKGKAPLPVTERLSVVHDLRMLASNGRYPLGEALSLVGDLIKDPSANVQSAAAGMVGRLSDDFVEPDLRPNARRFVGKVITPRLRELGLTAKAGEPAEVRSLREHLIWATIDLGDDAKLFAEADSLAKKWLDDPSASDAESIEMILRAAASRGDRKLYDRLLLAAKSEKDSRRRHALLIALAGFTDPGIVKASLALVLDGTFDPRASLALLWGQRHTSRGLVWDFVKVNVDKLLDGLPEGMREIVFWVPSEFCDEGKRADVESFLKDRAAKVTGAPRTLAQTLESISLCSAKREAHKESLRAFLKKQ